jgi:hypothetical protein
MDTLVAGTPNPEIHLQFLEALSEQAESSVIFWPIPNHRESSIDPELRHIPERRFLLFGLQRFSLPPREARASFDTLSTSSQRL